MLDLRLHGSWSATGYIPYKPLPAKASQPAAPYSANACAINSNTINSTGLSCSQPAQPAKRPVTAAKLLADMQVILLKM